MTGRMYDDPEDEVVSLALTVEGLRTENARLRSLIPSVAQAAVMKKALQKICGRREYEPRDFEAAHQYKTDEGIWTVDEYLADSALASQPPAAPVEPLKPMNFFSENVDRWGAAEWFDRMAKALRQQDAAVVAGDMMTMETCRNVAASSAMRLVHEFEQEVRAALNLSRCSAGNESLAPEAMAHMLGIAVSKAEHFLKTFHVSALRAPWSCAARKQALPEPADCNWPVCGCDPYADKVIAALEESGHVLNAPQGVRK